MKSFVKENDKCSFSLLRWWAVFLLCLSMNNLQRVLSLGQSLGWCAASGSSQAVVSLLVVLLSAGNMKVIGVTTWLKTKKSFLDHVVHMNISKVYMLWDFEQEDPLIVNSMKQKFSEIEPFDRTNSIVWKQIRSNIITSNMISSVRLIWLLAVRPCPCPKNFWFCCPASSKLDKRVEISETQTSIKCCENNCTDRWNI